MYSRRLAGGAAAAALALLASACADQLTSPAGRLPGAPAFSASGGGPTLIPNTVRYRDTGGKPARGRAGSAAVDALALLGRDGFTDVELRARPADPARTAVGTVARAQAKVYAGDHSLRMVRNVDGGQPLRLPGLPRGTRVDVQANVTGIDPHRTDVVSVSQTVRLRPDLHVVLGSLQDSVMAGGPLVVFGHVREMNGDMGAQANCVLLLDGQPVDRARGIWVDAGGFVNCFFTIPALAEGTHEITVRLDGVAPGDWDPANNAATRQVTAYTRAVAYWAGGSATTSSFSSRQLWHTMEYYWGSGVEQRDERTEAGTRQFVNVRGGVQRGFAAPVTIEMRETSEGRVLQEDAFSVLNDFGSPVVCGNRWNTQAGTSFHFCSYFGQSSEFQFFRSAGTVTYHSTGYYRTWEGGVEGDTDYWHWDNTGTDASGTEAEIGSDYGLTVRFVTPNGTTEIPLVMALEPFEVDSEEPDMCFEGGAEEWGWMYRYCQGSTYRATGREGFGYVSTLPEF